MSVKGINRVVLVGRLTRDAELKYTPGGYTVVSFSLAVSGSEKQGDQYVDRPDFFDVTIFGKLGEAIHRFLTKGQQVSVDGRMRQDRWEKDGQKHNRVGIVAESVNLVGGKSAASGETETTPAPSTFEDDVPF